MAEIINLRLARKARDRRKAGETAATNRARHGRTVAERRETAAETARVLRAVEGARREGDGEG